MFVAISQVTLLLLFIKYVLSLTVTWRCVTSRLIMFLFVGFVCSYVYNWSAYLTLCLCCMFLTCDSNIACFQTFLQHRGIRLFSSL
jgi:hypothetical protein